MLSCGQQTNPNPQPQLCARTRSPSWQSMFFNTTNRQNRPTEEPIQSRSNSRTEHMRTSSGQENCPNGSAQQERQHSTTPMTMPMMKTMINCWHASPLHKVSASNTTAVIVSIHVPCCCWSPSLGLCK